MERQRHRDIITDMLRILERDNDFVKKSLEKQFEARKSDIDTTNALTVVVWTLPARI
jgi:hypothetical protein